MLILVVLRDILSHTCPLNISILSNKGNRYYRMYKILITFINVFNLRY
jgi:hypothetical protein